ncbi:tyrosine-type recombinase/integrase [Candidatus Woesearchaeota archaeon]|nr:tyrosine-type recombinase/integrase [Candidatus Woesearchaeota archaeon]
MDVVELIKKEGFRRGFSIRTINTYCFCVKRFFQKCPKEPRKITKKDIREYLDHLIQKGACGNTLNVHLNSLKFMLQEILCKRVLLRIKYSKTPKEMPAVLTKEETLALISSISNPTHKLMIELMYSAGLRLSELVKLNVKDFELSKNYGWVRKGKCNKDRLFIIAEGLKEKIKSHIKFNNLGYCSYLFPGRNSHIHQRTIQEIVKKASKKADILKNVHPHTLRHSFATHLIEDGYDVASVQVLLGHVSAETTMGYLHMASPSMISVKSPFDSLNT